VVAVVGPACPAAVAAAQPLYEAAGIPALSPSTTAIASTHPPGRAPFRGFFRLAYSDAIQARALADFAATRLEAHSAYVVYFDDLSGVNLRDTFAGDFAGQVVGSATFAAGATAFPSAVEGIRHAAPDVVCFFGYGAEAAPFLRALRAAGVTAPFLATDRVRDGHFVAGTGAAAEGAYIASPEPTLTGTRYARFSDAYLAAYGRAAAAAPFTARAYDAASVVIAALRSVARDENGTLSIDESALINAIARTDFQGAGGPVRFDAEGNNVGTGTPVQMLMVRNGLLEEVGPAS
jgi:branched-chain amino acid transport system substrate-binding protein